MMLNHKVWQKGTGVARNFDWEGPKIEKSCDVIVWWRFWYRNNDDVTDMTS